jgi:hypothetical protein
LPENPPDPSEFGQFPVSSKVVAGDPAHNAGTFTKRKITAEVFFPATPGSEKGAQPYTFSNVHQNQPVSQQKKVPTCPADDPHPKTHKCCEPIQYYDHIYENLTMDTTHGPYPVIVFIHGMAGWRSYMLHLVTHWASRGFVVFAADYPGITEHDMVNDPLNYLKSRQQSDTQLIIDELMMLSHPDISFLKGHIDMQLLGITGHSMGGVATGGLSSSVGRVLIPMAGEGTHSRPGDNYSSLVIGGQWDTIMNGCKTGGYEHSPVPKRHLCVANAGHMTYSDMCWLAPAQGGITGIGISCGVSNSRLFQTVADQGCTFAPIGGSKMSQPEPTWPIVRYATAGTFEETLMCDKRMTMALADLPQKFNSSFTAKWEEDLGVPSASSITLV